MSAASSHTNDARLGVGDRGVAGGVASGARLADRYGPSVRQRALSGVERVGHGPGGEAPVGQLVV
jgi:hypothetical protein